MNCFAWMDGEYEGEDIFHFISSTSGERGDLRSFSAISRLWIFSYFVSIHSSLVPKIQQP